MTLPADDQILITRVFNAPKHRVYRAWTTPELVKRWWSGGLGEVTVVEIDLRVGGSWQYVMIADGGFEVGFYGEYREIVPNERIVSTEACEGVPGEGDAVLSTTTFIEAGGRTTVTLQIDAGSKEVRDSIIESGMEAGLQKGWDLLERLAVSL
ncbi:MAG TPA: SRPBCC family protein [Kribbella sp.]|nr:SRPBCC family protein [Kribbella sp.]